MEGEKQKGSFVFYEAEGDTCCKAGKWDAAAEAYTKALEFKPGHVRTLLTRSVCYIRMGRADLALKDADAVLTQNPKDYRGLFAKAEALFAGGDFEYALMFYHRGNHLRPSEEFRLGIQKSEQAIRDSISQQKLDPPPPPTTLSASRELLGRQSSQSLAETLRSSLSRAGARGSASPTGTAFTSLELVKEVQPPNKNQTKKLLGEMYADRAYLEELARDTGLGQVAEIASSGLKYLETRTEFWRQQNPPDPDKALGGTAEAASRSRPTTRASRTISRASSVFDRPHSSAAEEMGGAAAGAGPSGAAGKASRASSRQKYLEQTRYAIQTLENVNAAIEYGDPELGLKFAKGFLSRLATLDIPDKPRILGNLYSCMGITYMELGKLTLAAIHHRKDLDIAVKYNYKDAYLRALGNLGQVYQRMGDYSQAIAMYEKKLMFGDESEAPRLCENIGRCYLDAGDTDNAVRFADRAVKAAQAIDDREQLLVAYLLHGHALSVAGQHREAVASFEQCLELARAQGDVAAQANALTHLGNAYLQLGEVQRSIELQQQALELSAQLNQQPVDAGAAPAPAAAAAASSAPVSASA